jgi:M6 family metalloprotease-like protein
MTFKRAFYRGMTLVVILLFFLRPPGIQAQDTAGFETNLAATAGLRASDGATVSGFNGTGGFAAGSVAGFGNTTSQIPLDPGPLHIVAVMVEFEPDENRFTTGNGTFYLEYLDSPDIIIDPLPHDRGYFEAHLEFVKNYFERVSGNALQISFEVLPEVIRLDNEMKEYAPLGEDNSENFRLANLVADTWTAVRRQIGPDFSGLDPDRTAFVIFHAGAGRDIELTGTTLDKTPQDIPSVYLNRDALARLFNDTSFDGIDMGNGFRIRNSSILPQTQSRPGEDVTGTPFVVQLSINGILTGTIGSFLGLPDLFNTTTGASGIGRFGLMDGEAFFSLGGLFPPEPSAWEKIYMGWATPFDVDLNNEEAVLLPASVLRQPGSIARHRISSDEYFLVENRHRDPASDGVQITVRRPDGSRVTRTLTNADSLESRVINSISQPDRLRQILPPGVITDVSNFDWALPGGLTRDEEDSPRLLNGGMLIWHIDEAVIQSEISRNRVNANPDRRGVRVVEADGARDIGLPGLTFVDYGRGSAFDFWWSGNDFTVVTQTGERIQIYQNRFADDTRPDNRSNSGSPTFFEFFDFSGNLPEASFRVRPAGADWFKQVGQGIQLDVPSVNRTSYYRDYPIALAPWRTEPGDPLHILVPAENGVSAISLSTDQATGTDAHAPVFGQVHTIDFPWPSQPLTFAIPASGTPVAPATEPLLVVTSFEGAPVQGATRAFRYSGEGTGWTEAWQNPDIRFTRGLISSERGDTLEFDLTRNRLLTATGEALTALNDVRQRGKLIGGFRPGILGNELRLPDGSVAATLPSGDGRVYTGTINPKAGSTGFYLLTGNTLTIYPRNREPVVLGGGGPISWPVFADIDNDGSLDVLYVDFDRNRLEGRNLNGGSLWYFPLTMPEGRRIAGPPLVADLTGDEFPELIIPVQDSLSLTLLAFDREMKRLPGFPLYVGSVSSPENQPVHPLIYDRMLFAVSHTGDFKAWSFPDMGKIWWSGHYGNELFNKVTGRLDSEGQSQVPFGLLNPDETYNWPNPAGLHTHIRFQTSRSARIEIRVITYSGETFFKHETETGGGLPEDIYIDTSGWGNGVYFARVTARSEGTTETQTFKIGVMH